MKEPGLISSRLQRKKEVELTLIQLLIGLWKILSTTLPTIRSLITHSMPRVTHQLVMLRTLSQSQRTRVLPSRTLSSKETRLSGSDMPSREREDSLALPTKMEAQRLSVESMLMVPRKHSTETSGNPKTLLIWNLWKLSVHSRLMKREF